MLSKTVNALLVSKIPRKAYIIISIFQGQDAIIIMQWCTEDMNCQALENFLIIFGVPFVEGGPWDSEIIDPALNTLKKSKKARSCKSIE